MLVLVKSKTVYYNYPAVHGFALLLSFKIIWLECEQEIILIACQQWKLKSFKYVVHFYIQQLKITTCIILQ